jgi:mannan endo-1,6-alpha-mannosidase
MASLLLLATAVLSFHSLASLAILLDATSQSSVLAAAYAAAYGVQSLYNGNNTAGVLGKFPYPPYYWWESGAVWGGMIEYWHYTGDSSWVNVTWDALVSQLGPNSDFVVPVERFNEGNDDQAFWVFTALSAAEHGFPDPPPPFPSWIVTVQNAWELYVQRWNTTFCNGGLKWQFYPGNAGFHYK